MRTWDSVAAKGVDQDNLHSTSQARRSGSWLMWSGSPNKTKWWWNCGCIICSDKVLPNCVFTETHFIRSTKHIPLCCVLSGYVRKTHPRWNAWYEALSLFWTAMLYFVMTHVHRSCCQTSERTENRDLMRDYKYQLPDEIDDRCAVWLAALTIEMSEVTESRLHF